MKNKTSDGGHRRPHVGCVHFLESMRIRWWRLELAQNISCIDTQQNSPSNSCSRTSLLLQFWGNLYPAKQHICLLSYNDIESFHRRRRGIRTKTEKLGRIPLRRMAHLGPKKANSSTTPRQLRIYICFLMYSRKVLVANERKNVYKTDTNGITRVDAQKRCHFANFRSNCMVSFVFFSS